MHSFTVTIAYINSRIIHTVDDLKNIVFFDKSHITERKITWLQYILQSKYNTQFKMFTAITQKPQHWELPCSECSWQLQQIAVSDLLMLY